MSRVVMLTSVLAPMKPAGRRPGSGKDPVYRRGNKVPNGLEGGDGWADAGTAGWTGLALAGGGAAA
ncbi:hypothetical protein, partial [Phenylobacterium sp. CCH12-B4]|uniref:hypothetical protein n=1 Tax=Phenylobacterium sp. CCH12-B4 TaxID=1768784 RepID=UPI001E510816